jgi:hypothetical protein
MASFGSSIMLAGTSWNTLIEFSAQKVKFWTDLGLKLSSLFPVVFMNKVCFLNSLYCDLIFIYTYCKHLSFKLLCSPMCLRPRQMQNSDNKSPLPNPLPKDYLLPLPFPLPLPLPKQLLVNYTTKLEALYCLEANI